MPRGVLTTPSPATKSVDLLQIEINSSALDQIKMTKLPESRALHRTSCKHIAVILRSRAASFWQDQFDHQLGMVPALGRWFRARRAHRFGARNWTRSLSVVACDNQARSGQALHRMLVTLAILIRHDQTHLVRTADRCDRVVGRQRQTTCAPSLDVVFSDPR